MSKKIKIVFLLSLGLMIQSLYSSELEEGLKAGREALQNGKFSHNLSETVQSQEIQDILNQPATKEITLDPSAVSGNTANNIIRGSENQGGKTLNRQLLKQDQTLKQQQETVQITGIKAAGLKPEQTKHQDLTPNQIVNQNLLQMETFPHVRNPATEPAFRIVESKDEKEEKEFINKEDFAVSLQEEYVIDVSENTKIEPYEMGCSTTLLGNVFYCTKSLGIAVSPQPLIHLDKTITATFRGRAYNLLTFNINFNTGSINGGGNSDNYFHLSDNLNQAFGPNTQVTLQQNSPYHEDPEWVRHTIDAHPCYANGFMASYTAFQPKTGNRHKGNRNTIRGGTLTYRFTEQKINPPTILSEVWKGDCQDLEDLTALGECKVIKEECLEGREMRQFGQTAPFLSLSRECWKKRIHYQCQVPQGANDCESIPKDCQKVGSEFIDFLGQHAVEIHHFNCQRTVTETKQISKNKGSRFVPAGDYQKNNDIGEAIAGLNIAKEIADGFRGEARGFQGLFFAGKAMECTYKPKNCCGDVKGFWRRMTGCRETEQQLAVQLQKGNCHEVGQYRVKKSLLQKIGHVDKKGYCCFQSKLSRIIQEGARKQLPHLNWGEGEYPNCRALTVQEIQSINWSLIDFTEIAKDFIDKAKNTSLNPSFVMALQKQLSSHLEKAASGLKNEYPNTELGKKQQRENAALQEKIKTEDNKRRLKGTIQEWQ